MFKKILKKDSALLLLVPALMGYLFFSTLLIDLPGLYYDEVIFIDSAAPGKMPGPFYAWNLGKIQIPVMILPYLGALKAYFFTPLLILFHPSPALIRLPAILFGLGALLFGFFFLRQLVGNKIALIASYLVALDPSYIFQIRLDWGPVALMLFFKMGALFFLGQFVQKQNDRFLFWAGFFLGLGTFDKANFLWFLLALPVAALLVWPGELLKSLSVKRLLRLGSGFVLGVFPLIVFNIKHPGQMAAGQIHWAFWNSIPYKYGLIADTLDGLGVYNFVNHFAAVPRWFPVFKSLEPQGSLVSLFFGLSILMLGGLWITGKFQDKKPALFFLILTLLIIFQILISVNATGSHHVIMLYPFPHILVALAFGALATQWRLVRSTRFLFSTVAISSLLILLSSQLLMNSKYLESFRRLGGVGVWSDAIYALADAMKKESYASFYCMDWGIYLPVLALEGRAIRQSEVFWGLMQEQNENEAIEKILQQSQNPFGRFIFVEPTYSPMKKPYELFQKAAQKAGMQIEWTNQFRQRDGELVYLIARLKKSPLASENGEHYLFFMEGEDFWEKQGGDIDLKPAASAGKALGMFWGKNPRDYATYRFLLENDALDLTLVVSYAYEGQKTQPFQISIDGKKVSIIDLHSTGGYGYQKAQWMKKEISLGLVSKGPHLFTFAPLKDNQTVNLDFFALKNSPAPSISSTPTK